MARKAPSPFPSINIFIILFFFFSFTLSPFSPQVVSASVFKRLRLLSTEETQPTSTFSVLSLSRHPHSSVIKPPYDSYSDLVLSRLATYAARVGVGQPVKEYYLIADTGSQINWLQCLPCDPCFNQSDPIFDPSGSSSYSPLSCTSQQCTGLSPDYKCGQNNTCIYGALYGDNSVSIGEFATETVSFGSSGSVQKVAIGCGLENQGRFGKAAGILGLGGTAVGFPSQIQAKSFSYCLVDLDSSSSSTLEFNSAPPGDSILVPLIMNPKSEIYYYVELRGITINGEQVPIPASDYQIGEDGRGGIIVDSGTTITALPAQVYNSVRDTFVKYAKNLPPAAGIGDLDTCYDLSSTPTRDGFPMMSFQFSGGKTLSLKPQNYLFRAGSNGTFCLAFKTTSQSVSIIGNTQQQGFRVTYDLANKMFGFSPNKC
nr:protein ASPARTIC PROTEASE IN GUARD CELL 1-like [Coffea arabica]